MQLKANRTKQAHLLNPLTPTVATPVGRLAGLSSHL